MAHKVHVCTRAYVRSHGRGPRGFGGGWIFTATNDRGEVNWDKDRAGVDFYQHPGSCTYSEAKKGAVEWARKSGRHFVSVCT